MKCRSGALVHNDQRVLELPRPWRVQAEIGLQRVLSTVNARRHIYKGTARPHRAVKGRKLVISRLVPAS